MMPCSKERDLLERIELAPEPRDILTAMWICLHDCQDYTEALKLSNRLKAWEITR